MNTEPFISVIVPTYERPAALSNCLEALAVQHYPRHRFEVIVVDDGGSSPVEPAIARARGLINVTVITQAHAGPAAARNTAAAQAKGEFLAFTDDDCVPTAGWLRVLAQRLSEKPEHAFGGRTINILTRNSYSSVSQAIIDFIYARSNPDPSEARFFCTNNIALPAAQLARIGGFDPAFDQAAAEDRDLCDRWLEHGYRMTFVPEAVVYHAHDLTLRSFWRQHFNYGVGARRYYRNRAARGSGRFRPNLGFYIEAIRHFSRGSSVRRLPALFIWQLANTAGFVRESLNGHLGTDAQARSETQ